MNLILALFFCFQLSAAQERSASNKTVLKSWGNEKQWYNDTSLGIGLDFRRQMQPNGTEADFKSRFILHADRLIQERWLAGLQYSYWTDKSSSGAINVKQQNHEILLRAAGRVYAFSASAFWLGLYAGFDRSRMELTVFNDKQVRWTNWEWILAPEVSFRHEIFSKDFWMQEGLTYIEKQYAPEGEWALTLKLGKIF